MKNISGKNIILLIVSSFFFFNGWVEDVLENRSEVIPSINVKERLNEPFNNIRRTFPLLQSGYDTFLNEDNEFNITFQQIMANTEPNKKELADNYKIKRDLFQQHLYNFNDQITNTRKELDLAFETVNITAREITNTYQSIKRFKIIIAEEYPFLQKEYQLYLSWLEAGKRKLAEIQMDLTAKDIEIAKLLEQKITAAPVPVIVPGESKKQPVPVDLKGKYKNIWQEIMEADKDQNSKQSIDLFHKGNDFLNNKKYNEAINTFKEAAILNKNNYQAVHGIAKVYMETGNYDEAVRMVNIALQLFKQTKMK